MICVYLHKSTSMSHYTVLFFFFKLQNIGATSCNYPCIHISSDSTALSLYNSFAKITNHPCAQVQRAFIYLTTNILKIDMLLIVQKKNIRICWN